MDFFLQNPGQNDHQRVPGYVAHDSGGVPGITYMG